MLTKCLAALAAVLFAIWIVAVAQSSAVKAPFSTSRILATPNAGATLFMRKIDGSYESATFGSQQPYSLITGMTAIADVLSGGQTNLLAAAAGPANVGRAAQMVAGGKFTTAGGIGAAYTLFGDDSVYVANISASLVFTGATAYKVGPISADVVAADFNGDGAVDLAVPFVGDQGPGGLGILINNGDGTFRSPVIYTPGSSPISVAALDLNHDGILDLAVADNGSSSVYILLGKGDGTFTTPVPYPGSSFGLSITIADLDGDGNPDIAEIGQDGKITTIFNNGSGVFHAGSTIAVPLASLLSSIAAGDLNGDGKMDLGVVDGGGSTATVFLNTGGGKFQAGSTYALSFGPRSIILTDYNGDGKLDIVNATGDQRAFGPSFGSGNIDLLLGNGDGTFQGTVIATGNGGSQGSPHFLAVADFDGDGIPDAVDDGFNQTLLLFGGTKSGAFKPAVSISTGQLNAAGAVAGDFNGDGRQDLAVTDNSGEVGVLLNSAAGFQAPLTFSSGGSGASGIAAADFNHDGKLDLAVTNNASGTTVVFDGGGNGAFQLAGTYPTGSAPSQVIAADVNGDGKPDLVVVDIGSFNTPGSIYVLLNDGTGKFNAPVSYPASVYPTTAAVGDINGDGKPDLVVSAYDGNFHNYLVIFLNNGAGGFGTGRLSPIGSSPYSIVLQDFNGDGKTDMAYAICCGDTDTAYLQGNGDGTFTAGPTFNAGFSPAVLAVADFNGDGVPDLAVSLERGGMVGLLNNSKAQAGTFANLESAGASPNLAQQALVSAYGGTGSRLATTTAGATSADWPTSLGGTTVFVQDSAGNSRPAAISFASPAQVNYVVPSGTAAGEAAVTITASDGTSSVASANIVAVSPGLFILGQNLAAANVLRVSGGIQTLESVYQLDASGNVIPRPIPLNPQSSQVYLLLYGTGIRAAPLTSVSTTVGGTSVPVSYAGPQATYPGLDQINIGPLPASLAGAGDVTILLNASGLAANPAHVSIQ